MANIHLTPSKLAELTHVVDSRPASAKLRELTVEYAASRGGKFLEFWRLFRGDYFGEPTIMSSDEIAKRLNRPVSELQRIFTETMEWVRPRWQASAEYNANPPRQPSRTSR
jgi:hypothetical protein